MPDLRCGLLIATLVLGSSSHARADGAFLEGDVGLMTPLGDDDYESSIDESLKLGLRFGTRTGPRALDLSFDFTPANDELDSVLADVGIQRYRLMAGGRIEHRINPKTYLFVRGAVGLDLVHISASGSLLGQRFENSETDLGLALEVSGGLMFDLGQLSIGGKLGLPFAFHFDDDDPDDPDDFDLEYTGVDLDVAFVVDVKF